MEPLSFFGRFEQKVTVSCFSDSFDQNKKQQSNSSFNVTNESQLSYKIFKNSLLISANANEKLNGEKKTVLLPTMTRCASFPNVDIKIYQQETIKSCYKNWLNFFNYQQVNGLYIVFKHQFNGKNVRKSGKLFENVQRAVHFNHQNRELDRMSSHVGKRLLGKTSKKTFAELLPKN